MRNFFDDSGYTLAFVRNQKDDPSAFNIHDQGGFIPTHDEIEEFILNLRRRYSQLSKEEVISHNEKIYSHALKLKTQVRVGFIPKEGFVYLIKANETDRYKIGFSVNPFQRIKDLQKICPFPLSLLHLIKTDDMTGVEKHFHIMFDKYRVSGEWFDLPLDAINYFANYRLQEPRTKRDYLPQSQALAIHDLMQDGEWRTSLKIAMELKMPKNRVSHIMPNIRKHWNYESRSGKGYRRTDVN
jgi:hypothetical protein